MSEEIPVKKRYVGGRPVGAKALTTSQKAEAVALWRAGDVTLAMLSKKFGKRPETFSRLFKRMGIEKGSALKEAAAKVSAAIESRALNDLEENLRRIATTKEQHYKMSRGLAQIAWAEIVRAREAGLSIGGLKDIMVTLKLAGDVIGNARKELFEVLNVAQADEDHKGEDLPELLVRELTPSETEQLRDQMSGSDEMGVSEDSGLGLSGDDLVEGL